MRDAPFSIVCLSSQTWDTPLPTNRQQVMARAARAGHRVLFVETGDFLGKHLWRLVRGPNRRAIVEKLAGGSRVAPGIEARQLVNVLPYGQRYAFCNRINWLIGGLVLRRAARRLAAPRVLWIYDPRGGEAIGTFGEAFAVYDCVDDYQHQAGPSRRARAFVAQQDRLTGARARLVFATTPGLHERHSGGRDGVHLVPNVGDFAHFSRGADRAHAAPALLKLPGPVLGFVGNIVENKVDFELLATVASAFPAGTIVLAGPAEGVAREHVDALTSRFPNVRWLGLTPYEQAPAVTAAFDVALIPYLSNPYTASVFPLKVYEYLAAGKPVVAAGVPSVAGLEPHLVLTDGPAAFVAAIEAALAQPPDAVADRQAVAAANTWDDRTRRLLDLVGDELDAA